MTASPQRWSLDRFLGLFDLVSRGDDEFVAPNPLRGQWTRVFGGQVAAQSLRAAQLTVGSELHVHSLHAYFLRPGKTGQDILMRVERPRDGRSFTTRYVAAVQDDEVIFDAIVQFHVDEPGPEYQVPLADVGPPEDAPEEDTGGRIRSTMPFEMRTLGPQPPGPYHSTRRVWWRTNGLMPDDRGLHSCVVAYASDMGMVSAARAPAETEGEPWSGPNRLMSASLDHAMWFHRPIRADEWVFTDLRAISNHGARGLAMGTMHDRQGSLGVSLAQEALMRPRR